jgi:NCS1 family nucleobase:cation symporter-1
LSVNDPSLSNRDLAPTTPAQRTWGLYNYTALWFSMCMEITTYQLASGLIAKGMDWKQAVGTVLLGNLIVLVPMLLNAHAGAKYGIPFPGLHPRAVCVSRSKHSRNSPRGGGLRLVRHSILDRRLRHLRHARGHLAVRLHAAGRLWASFLGFWLLNMVVVWRGVESIRHLQAIGAPLMFVMAGLLLFWVHSKAGSWGAMLSTPSQFHSTGSFLAVFFPSLTAMVGYWATLALNIPDFTRYSKSQSDQAWGQALGLPLAMVLYTFVGIAVTSASAVLFGHPIWNPIILIGRIPSALRRLHRPHRHPHLHAQREHRRQRRLALKRLLQPLSTPHQLPHRWHDHRSARPGHVPVEAAGHARRLHLRMAHRLLRPHGPVAGIMIADYFLIRKTELDVNSLYHREGIYHYTKGFNPRAIIALVAGVGLALIGVFVPSLHFLYDYAWFVGFFVAGIAYLALMRVAAPATAPQAAEEIA